MCARSIKLFFFVLLLLALPAEAKVWNFERGSPLGIGLTAGAQRNPDADVITKPQSTSSSFSPSFGFEPFLDFGKFALRFSGRLHYYPVMSAGGSDPSGTFSETSDMSSFTYGAELWLVPYLSKEKSARIYLKAGIANGILS
jgi:hypothetical protein